MQLRTLKHKEEIHSIGEWRSWDSNLVVKLHGHFWKKETVPIFSRLRYIRHMIKVPYKNTRPKKLNCNLKLTFKLKIKIKTNFNDNILAMTTMSDSTTQDFQR